MAGEGDEKGKHDAMRDAGEMWLMREGSEDNKSASTGCWMLVDSLQKLLLDLLVLLHLPCTCTYLHLHLQTGQAGGRTHSLPRPSKTCTEVCTVKFQAGVRSTDDVRT